MNKLLVVLSYCQKDHESATRLLNWIKELDGHVDHALLLVADNAVPMETKKAIDALGKAVFTHSETILVNAPTPVGDNYHAPAAMMFQKAMGHIEKCYRWPWLWMEPDCVPLKHGWLDALAQAYEDSPKDYMGSTMSTKQEGLPSTVFFATAVYPQHCYEELKGFCDGKQAFDMAFSNHVVPRGINTPLIWHVFGAQNDPPTFKDVKAPGDGPNVGTMDSVPKQAVLMHRCKDGSLITLLRQSLGLIPLHDDVDVCMAMTPITPPPQLTTTNSNVFRETEAQTLARWTENINPQPTQTPPPPIKRKPGRPPKQPQPVPLQA